jgi:putative ABC transport system substrate-binding protein
MNNRRKLIVALGAGVLVAPFGSFAQPPSNPPGKVWRVGILPGGLLAPRKFQWDAFRQRMHDLGYVEGKNVQYEFRAPDKEGAPYDALAADLVRLNVDAIVATAAVAVAAAKRATQSIPIIMCPSADPISLGFVASLRRPGGNLTGVAILSEETSGKRLQLLREMMPKVTRVAFIWEPPSAKQQLEAAESAARQLGVRLQSIEVKTADALPAAFDAAVKGGAGALMVAQSPVTFGLRAQITALALKHRLPSNFALPANAVAGGLMSYGPNDTEYYRQAAVFVDKILKGAKPADLPVEQPTKFELAINRKTAKALGLTIPQSLLISADRVIE